MAALALLLMAGGAGAHTHPVAISAPAPGLPWALLVLGAFAPAFVRRRSPRLAALTLAVVLTVFAFETAFHSVHHGLGSEEPTACPTASASAHVAGTPVGLIAFDAPALPVSPALFASSLVVPRSSSPSPRQGRAPPSVLA